MSAYHNAPGVNWSALRHLRESPAHYRHALTQPRAETDAMRKGIAAHLAILEPERYAESVVVWDGERRAGNAWKAFAEEYSDRTILRQQDADEVEAMARAVRAHPIASQYLDRGIAEHEIRWRDLPTGLDCKARIDWLDIHDDYIRIVDLKTSRTTHPRRFAAHVAAMGYDCQLAHYRNGVRAAVRPARPVEVLIIAVEQAPPHDVGVFLLDDDSLYPGEEEVRDLMARLRWCLDTDEWPGRSRDLQSLELPAWRFPDDPDDVDSLGITIHR